MNYSENTLLAMPYTTVPKQWSGDEPGVTQDPRAGAAAPLAQDPNRTHLVLSSKGCCELSMEKHLASYRGASLPHLCPH